MDWKPIDTAPRDGTSVLVYAPGVEGLGSIQSVACYHPDAGWCIDELRHPTHWAPLPDGPSPEEIEAALAREAEAEYHYRMAEEEYHREMDATHR